MVIMHTPEQRTQQCLTERVAFSCIRRHQAFALPPVRERHFRVYEEPPGFRPVPQKLHVDGVCKSGDSVVRFLGSQLLRLRCSVITVHSRAIRGKRGSTLSVLWLSSLQLRSTV